MTFELTGRRIPPEWIDANGHVGAVWYTKIFDDAVDDFLNRLGMGFGMIGSHGLTVMAADLRISYRRELLEGQAYRTVSRLIGLERNKMRWSQELLCEDSGECAAVAEWLHVIVDVTGRKVCGMASEHYAALQRIGDPARRGS